MCCATTSKVNIVEAVQYSYGKIDIGMLVNMDGIAAGRIAQIRKGIRNCAKMERRKYIMIKTGKEREEIVQENVKSGAVWKTETYHYLGITINKEGHLRTYKGNSKKM